MSSNNTNTNLNNYIAYLNNVSNGISFYYLMITVPIGLIGNTVSFYIYTRPNLNRKTNTGFLYAWLCVLNILSILQYAFLTRSSVLFGYTPTFPCGLINYMRRTTFNWISWMQVYISFDRFVSVLYPMRVVLMSKKVKAILYWTVILLKIRSEPIDSIFLNLQIRF